MITNLIKQCDRAKNMNRVLVTIILILVVVCSIQFCGLKKAQVEVQRLNEVQLSFIKLFHERRIDHNLTCKVAEQQERLLHFVTNYKMKLDWTEPTTEACL